MSKGGACESLWNVDDDVTQAMSKGGGGACGYLCKISGKSTPLPPLTKAFPYAYDPSQLVYIIPSQISSNQQHWRRKRGGGQGGHVPPTFQSGGQRYVCAPPLSDPEFRDVPTHFVTFLRR